MNRIVVCLYVVMLFCFGNMCYGQDTAKQKIEEIFLKQYEYFNRIKSMHLVYSEHRKPSNYVLRTESNLHHFVERRKAVSFDQEGDKFRKEDLANIVVNNPNRGGHYGTYRFRNEIVAFDLSNYQRLNKDSLSLDIRTEKRDLILHGNNPFYLQYRLFDLGGWMRHRGYEALCDREFWKSFSDKATLRESSNHNGWKCKVIEIDYPEKRLFVHIYFAEEYDYYPVWTQVCSRESNQAGDEVIVDEIKRIETVEGPVTVPTVTRTRMWNVKQGKLLITETCSIDMKKLVLNKDIPDDVFNISNTYAHSVQYKEGSTVTNTYRLDSMRNVTGPLTDSMSCNTDQQTGIRMCPSGIWFGDVTFGEESARETIEIMPDKLYLKQMMDTESFEPDKETWEVLMKAAKSVAPDALERIRVESNSEYLSVRAEPLSESIKVHVMLKKNAPVGLLRENLLVHLNDAEDYVFRVPVVAEVNGEYKAEPAGLFFGKLENSKPVVRTCSVGPLHEKDDLEIVSPHALKGWLDVDVERADQSAELKVTCKGVPPATGSNGSLLLRIRSHRDGTERLIQIPLLADLSEHTLDILPSKEM